MQSPPLDLTPDAQFERFLRKRLTEAQRGLLAEPDDQERLQQQRETLILCLDGLSPAVIFQTILEAQAPLRPATATPR